MSAHWEVGTELECIRNDIDFGAPDARLVVGEKYRIRALTQQSGMVKDGTWRTGLAICLAEIVGVVDTDGWRYFDAYWPECFRPITKRPTSIAVFTALLTPTEDEIFREFEAAEFDYEDIRVPR